MKTLDVILYGIGRVSLDRRAHYLTLLQLLEKNYSLNVIEIFNNGTLADNPRSKEKFINLDYRPLLKNSVHHYSDFTKYPSIQSLLEYSKKYEDVHNDDYRSSYNLLQQLAMLTESSKYLQSDFVLAIRDDLLFNAATLVKYINKVSTDLCYDNEKFLTSFFHANRGVCERIYFGNSVNAKIILNRISQVKSYLENLDIIRYPRVKGLNGEWLMRYVVEQSRFLPLCAPFFTRRIRTAYIQKERLFPSPQHWRFADCTIKGLLRYYR